MARGALGNRSNPALVASGNPFAPLAARIDSAWSRAGYAPNAFSAIATGALAELEPSVPTSFDALTDWLFNCAELMPQRSADHFGQPPVTVYLDERFFIELLFWNTATTAIHQHAFSGAFRVLSGSSLHSIYHFETDVVVDPRLELGRLELRAIEVLEAGAVRGIASGREFIHSAFHLDSPSVTLVARTHADQSAEFEYKPPGLAIDSARRSVRTHKLLHLMGLFGRSPLDTYRRRLSQALMHGDAYDGIQLLLRARRQCDPETFALLLQDLGARFPFLLDVLPRVAEEELRRWQAFALRARIADAEQRFIIALLMNLPGRGAIIDAISQRYPGADPVEPLYRGLHACARRERLGFDPDEATLELLRGVLTGSSREELAARRGTNRDAVERSLGKLEAVPLLAPLFRN